MKKVSLLAILATVASTAAMAQTPVASAANCPKAFQGFGLKGNIGYGVGVGKQKVQFVNGESIKNDLGFNGVDGGIGVDYNHRFCNWALGIAFDANWASTDGKRTNSSTEINNPSLLATEKAQLENSLQLYGRAGYVLANMVMPFVGLGWDNSSWKHTVTATNHRNSKSKRWNAFLWKAGVDFLATKHVVLGLEYTGTVAGKEKLGQKTENGITSSGSFRPQYNKFALTAKLVY